MNDHPENQTELAANRAALTTDHAADSAGAGADDDALEFALRSLAEPALADDGFCARVMAQIHRRPNAEALPAQAALARLARQRAREHHQQRYALAGGAMGLALAWLSLQAAPPPDSAEALAGGLWPMAGLLCCGVVLAWVMALRRGG